MTVSNTNFRAILAVSVIAAIAAPLVADQSLGTRELANLSFEDLMNVKVSVPGAITSLTGAETPASVTLITAEDIRHTPARNIYDLIEVYVPGAIWLNYEEGPQLGIRGLISNRNTKYLLRVNGRTMNNVGHYGAMSELEQWDLGDIQQIEIVRGPGSVTYGPGAIAGVINITTHNPKSREGFRTSTKYVDKYGSRSLSVSHGYKSQNFSMFSYASLTRTPGFAPNHFLVTKQGDAGYIGQTIETDSQPLDYFADFQDRPQVSLFSEVGFNSHWQVWFRYTQQGSTWRGNETKTDFSGRMLNQQSVSNRQWTATLEYENTFRDDISLSTMLSKSSSDVERQKAPARVSDPDHVLNKKVAFSEDDLFLRGIVNWKASERAEIAVGAEYSRNHFGAPWGKSEKDMRLGDNGIIVSGPNSNAILEGNSGSADKNSTAIFVGSGWSTNSYALFSEANLELKPWLRLLISGRADKDTFTDWLFSPRFSAIARIVEGNYLKLIAQKSIRRNTAAQLYTEAHKGLETNTESLTGFELIYTRLVGDRLQMSLTGFRNELEIIAWNGDANITEQHGTLRLYGLEADLSYSGRLGRLGASYSVVKQLDWTLADGVFRSGISYADYNQTIGDGLQVGVGNDLANWPGHALKFFGQTSLSSQMTLHINSRILWDYQGMKDGLTGLSQAMQGTADETVVEAAIQQVNAVNTYDYDVRTNASLTWRPPSNLELQVFVINILGAHGNKRHSYDNGNDDPAPTGVRFVEEPTTWGMQIGYNL